MKNDKTLHVTPEPCTCCMAAADGVRILLPDKVKRLIAEFEAHGFEAYAVGGCVRDSLLGRTPGDWDVTTDASPEQIKALFRRTVDTGIAHGTVTVLLGGEGFEVTTYRIDGAYEDGRHPKEVVFTKSLIEDLKRRDFTINAMAYNEWEGLIDCFDGLRDLRAGIVRCVGRAEERFGEDALRILRCLRFSAQLGFSIDTATKEAVVALAPSLQKISAERIQAECGKLLCSPHPARLQDAYEYGVLQQFLPEVQVDAALMDGVCAVTEQEAEQSAERCCSNAGADAAVSADAAASADVTAGAVTSALAKKHLRWMRTAMLLRRLSPKEARTALRRLKYDNDTVRTVTGLVTYMPLVPASDETSVRRMIHKTGQALFPMLLIVWNACLCEAEAPDARRQVLQQIEAGYTRIMERGDCLSLHTLAVSGSDLIALGIAPGRALGELLNSLLEQVLVDPKKNDRETLLAAARKIGL